MNTIMKDQNWQDREALARYTLIAPLLDENLDPAKRSKLRKETAIKAEVSERTLYRYEAAYHAKGFTGLRPVKGACPKSFRRITLRSWNRRSS